MALSRRNFTLPDLSDDEAIAWLKARLRDVEEEIAGGKVTNDYNTSDVAMRKWIDLSLPPVRRREMLLNDLGILDPETYPPRDNAPVKRTVSRYL